MIGLALVAVMALLTSCGSGSSSPHGNTPPANSGAVQITTSTTFSPAFDPAITDYTTTAPGGSVQFSVNAPTGTQVAVDGHAAQTQSFTTPVKLTPGQSFSFVVTASGSAKTYYVRCLPADFPTWTTERPGAPQTEYYAITPNIPIATGGAPGHYLIITDSFGVPVWWYRSSGQPSNALLLSDGNIAWTNASGAEEHKFDGSLVRTFTADSSNGGAFDIHELQQLPNGDFILIGYVYRGSVDLTSIGGESSVVIIDNAIEEIAPSGALVWRWSTMDHIPPTEIDPIWWPQYVKLMSLADTYHMNSVEPTGDGFVVSFRHLNAVYKIDKASGAIVWKLGGTQRAESLAFSGDTYGNFGGQHDARMLPDGTLTVHDNGTSRSRAPRAARFRIDTTAKTAQLVEQVTDPDRTDVCGNPRLSDEVHAALLLLPRTACADRNARSGCAARRNGRSVPALNRSEQNLNLAVQ
jgi:hypothetical protein